jgi:hypothetical protein
MKWVAVAALIACAVPAGAQVRNTQEGEAMVGIAGQSDFQMQDRVRLSPVGVNLGFIVQPIFSNRKLSLVEQVSFFPVVFFQRQTSVHSPAVQNREKPLIYNALWMRLASGEPEEEGKFVYFAGGGMSLAIATPRDGHKVAPMVAIGMRRWFRRQLGFEFSLQCSVPQVGNTTCVLPMTSLWPFG